MSTRKIKDAVDHGTKELIYFKGHAKATYMSDGSTVEDTINNIESKIDLSDYVTTDELEGYAKIEAIPSLEGYVKDSDLPDFDEFAKSEDIPSLNGYAKQSWVESQGYAHQEDLLEISFNDIQDSPISIDDSGMINFVDESGNVGFQINEEGLRVTDVIAGEHKLSEKANASDIPSLDGYAKTEDIPSLDGLVKSEDLPNFDEFAKTEDIPSLDEYAKIEDIPSLDDYASKEWVNNKNYATEYDLKTIDYSSINNVPVSEDETGELNITDESGNIGMKVASEAVYAKDFVAGEHKLSEKVDKTYVDNSIAELVDGAPETLDTLNELAAALNDNADIVDVLNQSISNKQDTITDLEVIRQGAAKGATALQSYIEQYKGTVTGVKINGTTKSQSNGIVDLGTVITAHQDISGKQDKLVSGTNIKTINGTSILGSGDIVISGGSSSGGNGAYSEVNHGTSDTTFTLTPNTFHIWDEVASLTLDLGSETSGVANEFLFQFTSGATATTLSLPSDLKWANDTPPTIEANMIYQVSILKGLASVLSFDNSVTLIDNLCTYDGMQTVTFQYPVASDVYVYIGNTVDMSVKVPLSVGETTKTITSIPEPGSIILAIAPTRDNTYNYIF